ncbi:uncharacterized protein TNIN_153431 [Trichonephila inaurata madagascariensis]|uniref:Uncharacterized protein n=1 Tax=Trichonephila inaurata madagascariensis TaxID=2747483 RepID=A0A8X6XBI7_9ARAC|nr:uncharacterized protein TNIN_153431 [Trichonephila inaurata madagascariensis]
MNVSGGYSHSVPDGYGILWIVLKIFGIDVMEENSEEKIRTKATLSIVYVYIKKLSINLFPIILHLMQIYAISSWCILIEQELAKTEVMLSFMVVNILSTVLWHDVNRKKGSIKDLVIKCHIIETYFRKNERNISRIINVCLALAVTISTISALLCSFFMSTYSIEYKIFYSFFWLLKSENFICLLVRSLIILITYAILIQLPAVVAILSAAIYYKFSDLLGNLAENIEGMRYSEPNDEAIVIVMKRISSQIHRIRTSLHLIYYALGYDMENKRKTMKLLKNIMKVDFPQMTALGVLTIKPVLILSTFGSVLTYGLLVLSIKKNN